MPNRNNRRGKTAESRIAKILTRIIEWKFARTPGSGSGHLWKFFSGEKVRGDIVCIDKDANFPFMIESKKTTGFPWDLMFTSRPPTDFVDWWEKAKRDADADGKFAALVISRNQGPMVTVTTQIAWHTLGMDPGHAIVRLLYKNKMLMLCPLEDFATAFKRRSK